MSILLNGNKMRERLARILELAQETENNQDKQNEARQKTGHTRSGSFE